MTDAIASVGNISQPQVNQQNDWTRSREESTAFMSMLDSGLGTLTQRPEFGSPANQIVRDMSAGYSGDVGAAKADIVGGEAARLEQSSQAGNESLEERVKGLYFELTHYQIAWKIAQNVQRDISQVLRGN